MPQYRGKNVVNSLPPCNLQTCTKEEIKAYFENTYDLYEHLFTSLKDDSVFYLTPDRLRRPLIFYYCHTSSLYVNKMMLAGLIKERVNFAYEALFETGVDEMSWDDMDETHFDWPSMEEAREYRNKVRKLVLDVIDRTPLTLPITMDSPWWSIFLGFEHERIHLETSSVLIRQLPIDKVQKPAEWIYGPLQAQSEPKNELVRVPGGVVTLGKPRDFPSFGWDNEYGTFSTQVPSFEASRFLITNREFLEFVKAGGYTKDEYWTEEGKKWKDYRAAKHPTFWVCNQGCKSGCGASLVNYSHCNLAADDNTFKYRAMYDVIEMPWDWPAEVNYHEAKAFCVWKGPLYRLPTEAEHFLMRGKTIYPANSIDVNRDIIFHDPSEYGNLNMKFGSSTPVNMFSPTSAGFYDVMGNVWEWGEDHFNGLDGFSSHPYYDDFSSPCFDGRHNVILGGSWIATGDEASDFARFAFRRHFFQHCGFRLVKSEEPIPVRLVSTEVFVLGLGRTEVTEKTISTDVSNEVQSTTPIYTMESIPRLNRLLTQHYGSKEVVDPFNLFSSLGATDFFVKRAHLVLDASKKHELKEYNDILEIGCEVGRSSWEYCNSFKNVVAIDSFARSIYSAQKLKNDGEISFSIPEDGSKTLTLKATIPSNVDASKVDFRQLTWLPNVIGFYDLVIFNNLCILANPTAWLLRIREIVRPGGLVVISFTTWNSKYTYKDCWLGGGVNGKESTVEEVKKILNERFELLEQTELPSVSRTDSRNFKVEAHNFTFWKKRC